MFQLILLNWQHLNNKTFNNFCQIYKQNPSFTRQFTREKPKNLYFINKKITREKFIYIENITNLQGNLQGRLLSTLDSIPKIFHTPKALNGDIIIYKSL